MYHLTALVTCLALMIYLLTSVRVARARAAFGIKAPAISGNPDFERVFRVQMNTLEWLPIFLPSLWLFAAYWDGRVAAALGAVWIVGRVLYAFGYTKEAKARAPGFGIQALATAILLFGALGKAIWMAATGDQLIP